MNTIFADVVEEVKQLSFDEKQEVKDLVEEKRDEIWVNGERSQRELKENKLQFSSDIDELMIEIKLAKQT